MPGASQPYYNQRRARAAAWVAQQVTQYTQAYAPDIQWLPVPSELTKALPQGLERRPGWDEWLLFQACQRRQYAADAAYEQGWRRFDPATTEAVWDVLCRSMPRLDWTSYTAPFPSPDMLTPDEWEARREATLQGVTLALALTDTRKCFTARKLMEALYARFCPSYRAAIADGQRAYARWLSIGEVPASTLRAARRELLYSLSQASLRRLIVVDIPTAFPSLYTISRTKATSGGYFIEWGDAASVEELRKLITADPAYTRPPTKSALLFADDVTPEVAEGCKIMAGYAYDVVPIGAERLALMAQQSETVLWLDAAAFRRDYRMAEATRQWSAGVMREVWGVDVAKLPRLSPEKRLALLSWTKERVGKRKAARAERTATRAPDWFLTMPPARGVDGESDYRRHTFERLLPIYDAAEAHLVQYQTAYDQLVERGAGGYEAIRSGCVTDLNRRYGFTHLWPMHVTSKTLRKDKEGTFTALSGSFYQYLRDAGDPDLAAEADRGGHFAPGLRRSWFKMRGADGGVMDLVGVDVSSSQLQIASVFLGISELEAAACGEAYKSDRLRRLRPFVGAGSFTSDDAGLKLMAKVVEMTDGYGSKPHQIVRKLMQEAKGIGVAFAGATRGEQVTSCKAFLQTMPGRADIEVFKLACAAITQAAREREGVFAGVEVTDPFCNVQQRWNPPQFITERIGTGNETLAVRTPGKWVKTRVGKRARRAWVESVSNVRSVLGGLLAYLIGCQDEHPTRHWALGWAAVLLVLLRAEGTEWSRQLTQKTANSSAETNTEHPTWWRVFRCERNDATGDYRVDWAKLGRRLAPCVIHMLDALFSSLVLKEAAKRRLSVVGIHDAWMTAERVQERPGVDVLRELVTGAGEEWLRRLECVYDDFWAYLGVAAAPEESHGPRSAYQQLLTYLQQRTPQCTTPTWGEYARLLKRDWQHRVDAGRWPVFRVDTH